MNLKIPRLLSGKTQWQLALDLGCSQSRISFLFHVLPRPREEERSRIAEILQVDLKTIEFSPLKETISGAS